MAPARPRAGGATAAGRGRRRAAAAGGGGGASVSFVRSMLAGCAARGVAAGA